MAKRGNSQEKGKQGRSQADRIASMKEKDKKLNFFTTVDDPKNHQKTATQKVRKEADWVSSLKRYVESTGSKRLVHPANNQPSLHLSNQQWRGEKGSQQYRSVFIVEKIDEGHPLDGMITRGNEFSFDIITAEKGERAYEKDSEDLLLRKYLRPLFEQAMGIKEQVSKLPKRPTKPKPQAEAQALATIFEDLYTEKMLASQYPEEADGPKIEEELANFEADRILEQLAAPIAGCPLPVDGIAYADCPIPSVEAPSKEELKPQAEVQPEAPKQAEVAATAPSQQKPRRQKQKGKNGKKAHAPIAVSQRAKDCADGKEGWYQLPNDLGDKEVYISVHKIYGKGKDKNKVTTIYRFHQAKGLGNLDKLLPDAFFIDQLDFPKDPNLVLLRNHLKDLGIQFPIKPLLQKSPAPKPQPQEVVNEQELAAA